MHTTSPVMFVVYLIKTNRKYKMYMKLKNSVVPHTHARARARDICLWNLLTRSDNEKLNRKKKQMWIL